MPNNQPSVNKPALEYLFHPRSVAVAGVSDSTSRPNGGRVFTESLVKGGYPGPIYPVGRDGGTAFGLTIYRSITDIPDSIDLVISAIPAQYTLQLVADSAAKGAQVLHMFTSGFSELGDDQGRQLEAQLTSLAQQRGIRVIGPNCMGLYCPETGLSYCTDFSRKSGPVAFLSQSGGHSIYGVIEANTRGIYFSKVISFGNAADLNESDFLEYLTDDARTEIIALYIEGVKDAPRFVAALKRAARLKPVIVYKGGATQGGARTVSSHTGAIAGAYSTWSSLIKQVGAVQVHSVTELVDVVLLFRFMSPPRGENAAIIGLGGGASVQATDDCLQAGLAVPALPAELSQKVKDRNITEAGKIFQNPIDIFAHGSRQFIANAIKTVAGSDRIDVLIPHITFDQYPTPEVEETELYLQVLTSLSPEIKARMAVVLHAIALARSRQVAAEAQARLAEVGLPVYPSFSRAANAIVKFLQYHRRRQQNGRG